MPNPNPTALDVVYGRMSSGGCQHFTWVVTVDDPVLGLTVGQRLRESVVAGVGVFWRVIDPTITTNLPSHPDITKIDLLTGGGGGGGPVTVNTTDTEYLRWEVTEPDTTLGLVKGDYVIQSIVNNISTWRKFGSTTALASAPDTAKLRPESDGGTMIEYRVTTAHGTAPSAFTVGEILWRFVSDDGSVIWRREGVKAPIETPPIMSNLERVVSSGGASNAAGTVIEWRVDIAHGTAPSAFAVNEILREFVGADNTSTWRREGSTTVIATAPVRANLTRLDYAEILDSINVLGTTVTANQNSIINLLTDGGRLLATTINRTVDSNGSVTQVIYNLANGTITDLYTYGANSSSEWISVARGALVSINNDNISNLRIDVTGNRLLYNSTVPITALSGTLSGVDNGDRTLSHISSGVAAISGPPIAVGDTGVSIVSLTSVTPTIAPVINAPVTNNRTATLSWTTNNGFTNTGAAITGGIPGAGTVTTTGINASNAFEIIVYQLSDVNATPIVLDSGNVDNTTWAPSNNYLLGVYTYLSDWYYSTEGAGASSLGVTYATAQWIKFTKSGNDIVISSSTDGVTFTTRHTEVGILSGVPTVYLRSFSVNGGIQTYDVTVVN